MAFVTDAEGQRFRFFEGATLEAMIEEARIVLPESGHTSWTLAYEGYVTVPGDKRVAAIMIESWVKGMEQRIAVAQPWRRDDAERAQFDGAPVALSSDAVPTAFEKKFFDPVDMSATQTAAYEAGVASNRAAHERGAL